MAFGDLLDDVFQVELREVLFDSKNCDNGLVITEFLSGFGVPQTRNQEVNISLRHGQYASPQYLGARPMNISIAAWADSIANLMALKSNLGFAFAPIDAATDADFVIPLCFTLADAAEKYVVFGKPIRAEWVYNTLLRTYGSNNPFSDTAVCEFLATDPRIYSLTPKTGNLTLGVTTGGHGWPHGWPHGWGTATPGSATCINAGNFMTYPTITISAGAGAFTNPILTNATTGESWTIALGLAIGDTLVVDMAAQTALLGGTANRESLVTRPPSSWWALASGSNVIQLGGTGATGTAVVSWRDAYLI